MDINLNKKKFGSLSNSDNGEVGADTIFEYNQEGSDVWASYSGGTIRVGHLIARMDASNCLHMRYHHINTDGDLMTGECFSKPELLENGKIRLHEEWRWTSGDRSGGTSVLEEL